MVVCLL